MKISRKSLLKQIDKKAKILDIGCYGFGQYHQAQLLGLTQQEHFGVDYCDIKGDIPKGYIFKKADLNYEPIPFDDDAFDLVIANHLIEHLNDPVDFFGECARVMKPGGIIYIEAPSERSLFLPGFPFNHEAFFSLSLFDDPTHSNRPWTPQSFYRLTKYWALNPIEVGYVTSWKARLAFPLLIPYALLMKKGSLLERVVWGALGWASYLIATKPNDIKGKPKFYYYIPSNRS